MGTFRDDLSLSFVLTTPLHWDTWKQGHVGTSGVGTWAHAKVLSTKDDFYFSVSRYEISGRDLGWVWLGPEMGKGGSLKGEREVIAGQKSGDGRMLRYHCSTPRHPISQTNHSLSTGLLALPPHWTQSSLKPGQSCVQLNVPKA